MQESGTRSILSNIRSAIATQLFVNILRDSYRHWHGAYDSTCRHTGSFYRAHSNTIIVYIIVINRFFFLLVFTYQKHSPISPEVYCYLLGILVVWIALISSFKEDLIARHTWIPNFASIVTVIALVVFDIIVPLYHSILTHVMPPLRPAYDSYVIFAIYIFLPVSDNMHSCVLGMATTICYLILMGVMTYRLDQHIIVKVIER